MKEENRPTYGKYITGEIKRFDPAKNAFQLLQPDNKFGEELRQSFKKGTGYDSWTTALPYSELEMEDRFVQSLAAVGWHLCQDYHPENPPVTPRDGRVAFQDKAWMSRMTCSSTIEKRV